MQTPELLTAPSLSNPIDAQNMAGFVNQVNEVVKQLSENTLVKIVTVAPTAKQLTEMLNKSEVVILHHATQANRRVYYKYQGVAYVIASA